MAIKEQHSTRALSLFSGAGGLDIGVRQAGFHVVACIEIDPNCCDTLRLASEHCNCHTEVIQEDIRNVDPEKLRVSLGIEKGGLDLLFGGSPCQSFSQIGRQEGIADARGLLLFEFVRFARALEPKAILMEQVKGVLNAKDGNGSSGGVLRLLKDELRSLGYCLSTAVLNAADFGVPQLRERVFVVAVKGSQSFSFPDPTHGANSHSTLFPTLPRLTVGDALAGLPTPTRKGEIQPADSHYDVTPKGDRCRISGVPEGQHLASQLHLPSDQRKGLTKKDTTKFRRLANQKQSLTLRCGEIFYHPTEDRYLTPREYMRLHGYPDSYRLQGPIRGRSGTVKFLDQHRQVANSVPPPLGRVVASAINQFLRDQCIETEDHNVANF